MKKLITIVLVLILLLIMVPATPVLATVGVVERQVDRGVDDCLRVISGSSAQFSVVSQYMSVGHFSVDAYRFGNAQRYRDIKIPKGADILDAYITVTAQLGSTGTDMESRISAEDVNNPEDFSNNTVASFDERYANHTTAVVKWNDSSSWKKDEEYESPDISAVIQEIVDRSGWRSGNSVVVFWEDFDSNSDLSASKVCYSYEGSSSGAAKLYIKYTYNGTYYEDEAGELETQIESLETQINTLNTRMAELGGMIVLFRGYVNSLSKESVLLRTEYASLANKFETEISALRLEVTSLKTNLESITEIVRGLETDVSASVRFAQLEKRFVEVESEPSRKLTLLIWLVASPLILLIAVAGYSIYRRQR